MEECNAARKKGRIGDGGPPVSDIQQAHGERLCVQFYELSFAALLPTNLLQFCLLELVRQLTCKLQCPEEEKEKEKRRARRRSWVVGLQCAVKRKNMKADENVDEHIRILSASFILHPSPNSLRPLYIRAHLELSPLGLEVGLNFSPTLQSGP